MKGLFVFVILALFSTAISPSYIAAQQPGDGPAPKVCAFIGGDWCCWRSYAWLGGNSNGCGGRWGQGTCTGDSCDTSYVYQRSGDWTINWRGHGDDLDPAKNREIVTFPLVCLWVQFCNNECEPFEQSMRCTNAPWVIPMGGIHIDPIGPCE
ncbi:MAG: hypothetical protein MUC83_13035 [Pirellula sp.]|nr:hypothetical protein [Pirellula sp.]